MSVYIVTYDLRSPGRNYDDLYAALKKYTHCHDLESVWFVDSQNSAATIRDHIKQSMDSNDGLFVGKLTQSWGSWSIQCAVWLNATARTW